MNWKIYFFVFPFFFFFVLTSISISLFCSTMYYSRNLWLDWISVLFILLAASLFAKPRQYAYNNDIYSENCIIVDIARFLYIFSVVMRLPPYRNAS